MLHIARLKSMTGFVRRLPPLYLVMLALSFLFLVACGVESGDRTPARRDEDRTGEFHRSPVTAFEQFRVDLTKTDEGCSVDPADITVADGQRVRLAVQLQSDLELKTTATGSTTLEGEREVATYQIDGLIISGSGGAFGTGVSDVNLELDSGTRRSYDFNAAGAGAFDILCDGNKVGTFTVN